jgi:uncharacterized membrane protein
MFLLAAIDWNSVVRSGIIGGVIGLGIAIIYMVLRTLFILLARWVRTGSFREKKN